MSDVKWIKIKTDMFEDEKIKLIEALPECDTILIIWVKILSQAGKCNASGHLILSENIPYTDEMLATIFNRPLNSVRNALNVFEQFNMIERNEFLKIANWEKHQNIEGLEKIKEQNRERKRRQREKEKQLKLNSRDVSRDVTQQSKNKNKNKNKESTIVNAKALTCPHQDIMDSFNKKTKLQKVIKITDQRKKAMRQIWTNEAEENIAFFENVFDKVSESTFLNGDNNNNWTATFDWIMKRSNIVKIIEGNYDKKKKKAHAGAEQAHNFKQRDMKDEELESFYS